MGTARTGSGKTLAFLIPVIESLIRNKITEYDGLAALIVSPTRELAVQIFEVLTKIGKYNTFSAGLVTGGKDVQFEKESFENEHFGRYSGKNFTTFERSCWNGNFKFTSISFR